MLLQKNDEAESGKMQTTEHHGEANVELGERFLEKTEFEKNLGMVISLDLS